MAHLHLNDNGTSKFLSVYYSQPLGKLFGGKVSQTTFLIDVCNEKTLTPEQVKNIYINT